MSVCVILHFPWQGQCLQHQVGRAGAPRAAALPVLALTCSPALLCPRSRDGGGLGTRDWAPDDLGRREDNPDLGHGPGDESSGNPCELVPSTFSLLEPIPKHLGLLWEELPAPGAPASLLPSFPFSLFPFFPAPGLHSKVNKTTEILRELSGLSWNLLWVGSNVWGS